MPYTGPQRQVKVYRSFNKEEFEEYFSQIGAGQGEDTYGGPGWQVRIASYGLVKVGGMTFPEVRLEMTLSPEVAEGFLQDLKMAFLRGGG